MRYLACSMCIKKARLVRRLEDGADPAFVARVAKAFNVPPVRLLHRAPARAECGVYTVNGDGSLVWEGVERES